MSLKSVRAFFAAKAPDIAVIESDMSSATVTPCRAGLWRGTGADRQDAVAARRRPRGADRRQRHRADGQQEGQGALRRQAEDADAAEVADITGHEVGGVCPFGLKTPLPVYCDVSLQAFDEVVPAAGSTHSAVRIAPMRMAELTVGGMGRCVRGEGGRSRTALILRSEASCAQQSRRIGNRRIVPAAILRRRRASALLLRVRAELNTPLTFSLPRSDKSLVLPG